MTTQKVKLFASCPVCAHKLCKGDTGSVVEIYCPRCSTIVRVEYVSDTKVNYTILESQKKKVKNKL